MESSEEKQLTFTVRHGVGEQSPSRNEADGMLSLRIPASALLEVNPSSEFLLEPFSANETEMSGGVLRKSHDVDDEDDDVNVRAESSSTHIYEKHSENELVCVGDAVKRVTIQTSKEVEALGRKARERLEEEQRKRREIVRLEQEPEEETAKKAQAPSFAAAIRKQRPRQSSILKRKRSEKFSDSFAPGDSSTAKVDPWMPSVSHVSLCPEGEKSSVIRLHGLPESVKPETIRRFFSGLDAERIFVVLSNDSRIREWDERKHPSQILVERHKPCFRVYVKFVSSPVADMAVARSGELLYVDGQEKIGIHLGMTKVSKTIANYLQHNMAVDDVNGCSLHETLVKEETRLGTRVPSFLWTMAVRDLSLSSSPKIPLLKDEDSLPWYKNTADLNPLIFSDYQKLARHYNSLVEEYNEMERSTGSLDMKEWDPSYLSDAVIRMKRAALDRLMDEIENVKLTLYRARIERRRSLEPSDNDI